MLRVTTGRTGGDLRQDFRANGCIQGDVGYRHTSATVLRRRSERVHLVVEVGSAGRNGRAGNHSALRASTGSTADARRAGR
jgi:hypothetical protein